MSGGNSLNVENTFACQPSEQAKKSGMCDHCAGCALRFKSEKSSNSKKTFSFGGAAEAAEALVMMIPINERYFLRQRIKAGGMGTVYEAWDITLSRVVVVKVMHHQLTRCPILRARFRREQTTQGAQYHQNLMPAYDAGESPVMGPFIVMPLIVGETLKERLASQNAADELLDICLSIKILRDIATALDALHKQGIVHRDLKPSNVLLPASENPLAILIDYGVISIPVQDEERLTAFGTVLGTVDYMSPEQKRGELNIDYRSDLFALGVLAWEMLSGSRPYPNVASRPGNTPCGPPPVCALRPDIPQTLSDLIDELIQAVPDQRPKSAAEIVARLNQILRQLAS